jgi:tellurite resistance protein TehA-like permease
MQPSGLYNFLLSKISYVNLRNTVILVAVLWICLVVGMLNYPTPANQLLPFSLIFSMLTLIPVLLLISKLKTNLQRIDKEHIIGDWEFTCIAFHFLVNLILIIALGSSCIYLLNGGYIHELIV